MRNVIGVIEISDGAAHVIERIQIRVVGVREVVRRKYPVNQRESNGLLPIRGAGVTDVMPQVVWWRSPPETRRPEPSIGSNR